MAFDLGDGASEAVGVQRLDSGLRLPAKSVQAFSRFLPERLVALGCINGVDAYLALQLRPVTAHGQGVSVADGGGMAEQGGMVQA